MSSVSLGNLFPASFSFASDPCRFSAVVDEAFSEPRMLQCGLGGDPCPWVVDKYLAEKVEKLFVEAGIWGDDFLEFCQSHALVSNRCMPT